MRFYVVAVTTSDSPAPQITEAWPVDLIEDNGVRGPVMLNRALSEAYADADTLTAGVMAVEIPDADVLPHLSPIKPPTVAGTAQPPAPR